MLLSRTTYRNEMKKTLLALFLSTAFTAPSYSQNTAIQPDTALNSAASACSDEIYIAVDRENTRLYSFNPMSGITRPVPKVLPYAPGYSAIGLRNKDKKIYGMNGKNLIVVDPVSGAIEARPVSGFPDNMRAPVWFNGEFAADGNRLMVSAGDPTAPAYEIDVDKNHLQATALAPSGSGRWDDWVFHPIDKRLYSVEGDNGNLLFMNMNGGASEMKTLLKSNVFPKAEAGAETSRSAYAAMFFDNTGMFYAIDSRGNVNRVNLEKSTLQSPITGDLIGQSERVGGAPIDIDRLEVINAAGCIRHLELDPSYDMLKVLQTGRGSYASTWPVDARIYSYRLTLINNDSKRELRKFRIDFKLPQGGTVQSSGVDTRLHAGNTVYLDSTGDQVLMPGHSRDIDIQITVPGKNLPEKAALEDLQASRLKK
jgi:hypothetical protein